MSPKPWPTPRQSFEDSEPACTLVNMPTASLSRQQFLKQLASVMPAPRPNLTIDIVKEGVRKDEDWWYVPVMLAGPNGAPVPMGVYVNVLASAEIRAFDELRLNVLFIPTLSEPDLVIKANAKPRPVTS